MADGEGPDKTIIFASADNIQYISESDEVFVDGTFQTCSTLIFTIHSFKNGNNSSLLTVFFRANPMLSTYEIQLVKEEKA